jgi:ATP-dependent RNA helicase RhlE
VTFSGLDLDKQLLQGLKDLGFTRPTQIQADAIPPALEGRDLLACAATGSGKTAAFMLPILHKLIGRPRGKTRALVVTPTRELAAQILESTLSFATHTGVTAAAIFGGVGMGPQEHALRSGVDVIIATPGRLLDHLRNDYAKLDHVEFLVLDEADRMLDMGFLPDIRRVLRHLTHKRQTLFFSATMPRPIGELAQEMLHRPVTINVERQAAPAQGITQAIYPVSEELKAPLFLHLLKTGTMRQALAFTRTKHRANRLFEYLEKQGIKVARIHGNRSQAARTDALSGFKSGSYQVLVATDIAQRGIDVEALEHVVNFDVPVQAEDYIHRVGRTGRAEATGDAFTFVSPQEEDELRAIERAVGRRLPRVMVPDFDYKQRPAERFEVPIAERIAEIRARKKADRERAAQKAAAKAARQADEESRRQGKASRPAQRQESRPAPRGDSPYASGPARPAGTGPRPGASGGSGGSGGGSRRRRGGRGRGPGGGSSGSSGGSRGPSR